MWNYKVGFGAVGGVMWGASGPVRAAFSGAVAASALLCTLAASQAADLALKAPPIVPLAEPRWFVEGDVGASWGLFDHLNFLNPIGTADTLSPVNGNFIVLSNQNLRSTSFTGGSSVGYFFTNQIFAKASYQYFGKFSASGFALFPAPFGNVRQDLSTTSQGLLVGLGGDFNLTPAFFIEPVAQIGVGFLRSSGVQGANIGLTTNVFPTQNNTNFIAGAGLGVGYHVTRMFDVLVAGNYYYLGKANTGTTGAPPPGSMNVGEQLQANLSEVAVTATGRLRF
jgi:Autotransporter beta-domain